MRALVGFLLCAGLWGGGELASRAQAEALAFAEAQGAGRTGTYAFRALQPPVLPPLRPGQVALEPSHLSKQDPVGRFFVAMKVLVDGRPAGTVRVDLEGRWTGELLRARSSLDRKQALVEDLFERVPFEGQLPPGALTELPDGMRLRQPLQAGKWLTRMDLEPIPLVKSGERVRLTVRSEDLLIQAEAQARSSGAMGETIRLELPGRRMLTATVSGPGEALIRHGK